jgi:hypothetical protein
VLLLSPKYVLVPFSNNVWNAYYIPPCTDILNTAAATSLDVEAAVVRWTSSITFAPVSREQLFLLH